MPHPNRNQLQLIVHRASIASGSFIGSIQTSIRDQPPPPGADACTDSRVLFSGTLTRPAEVSLLFTKRRIVRAAAGSFTEWAGLAAY